MSTEISDKLKQRYKMDKIWDTLTVPKIAGSITDDVWKLSENEELNEEATDLFNEFLEVMEDMLELIDENIYLLWFPTEWKESDVPSGYQCKNELGRWQIASTKMVEEANERGLI